jgi:flagellin-like hook-associated protein FlgL
MEIGYLLRHTVTSMFDAPVYRGTIIYSNSVTGEIRVRVPVLAGVDGALPISYVGRAAYNGVWPVPSIGSQIVVTADDANLTNVFWLQVAPDPTTSLTGIQAQIDTINSDVDNLQSDVGTLQTTVGSHTSSISNLTSRSTELESYKDAFLLGVFN